MPKGGARVGSGRKPKTWTDARLHGSRQRSVVRFPSRSDAAAPPSGPVAPPADIAPDAAAVWAELSPFAREARTLTAGTAAAFAMLCRAVVLERALGASRDAGQSSHRGMMQRVEAGFVRFSLAPLG